MKTSIGTLAFLLTIIIQAPQAIKVVRTKHTKDLSLPTYLLLVAACGTWVVYGLMINDLAIWFSNAIGMALAVIIVTYKLRFG